MHYSNSSCGHLATDFLITRAKILTELINLLKSLFHGDFFLPFIISFHSATYRK